MLIKEVRDPVHGFIYFNEIEMKIVGTPVFQRLRYIRQLAFTHLVYPGAEHSRFTHSMGVMEFATKMFDILLMKDLAKKKSWSDARVRRNGNCSGWRLYFMTPGMHLFPMRQKTSCMG